MKLKKGFVLHNVGGEHMAVATGETAKVFNGLIRNNDQAHFIFSMLLEDITEDQIVEEMFKTYDAPREQIAADVHRMLERMREEGILDE